MVVIGSNFADHETMDRGDTNCHLLGTKAGMACIHFFGSEHTSLQTIHVLHLVIKPDVSHHEAGKTPFEVASFPSQQICLLAISPGSPGLSHTPRF